MQQVKLSITPSLSEFLANHEIYGFKDKSSMVRKALLRFKEELEVQKMKNSADLYAEIYEEDKDLKELTEAGVDGWPE